MADLESQTSERRLVAHIFQWDHITSTTTGGATTLHDISGSVQPGELMAVMGPSGAGKTTLLDTLAGKSQHVVTGKVTYGGTEDFDRSRQAYVEQDDALLGMLTVEETLSFAARLSLPRRTPFARIKSKVDDLVSQLGLSGCRSNFIGSPIQRGISGGQKRRVTIGQSLIRGAEVLFLDEPTSGLDSATSKEVMSSISEACRRQKTIVIATIHQPSWDTLIMFDKLLLLSHGKVAYNDTVDNLVSWLESIGRPVQPHRNPIDAALELINDDFKPASANDKAAPADGHPGSDTAPAIPSILNVSTPAATSERGSHRDAPTPADQLGPVKRWRHSTQSGNRLERMKTWLSRTNILMERNTLNYRRNLLAYGVRFAMYVGLGLLLATIWIRLGHDASRIQDRLSVYFFGVAFLSFMSVAGIPSFLEERAVFMRERSNHLYSSAQYAIANSIVNIPFLFVCSLAFQLIMYWAVGLKSTAPAFFRFFAFLFLSVYAAESQVLIFAAFVPIFVAALALSAFANGFWMCVQGYFILAVNMPRFWYYWAHWIDYQTWAFNAITKSDLIDQTFACPGSITEGTCRCPWESSLIAQGQCAVSGDDVLRQLDIDGTHYGTAAGVIVAIIIVYRLLFWTGLAMHRH